MYIVCLQRQVIQYIIVSIFYPTIIVIIIIVTTLVVSDLNPIHVASHDSKLQFTWNCKIKWEDKFNFVKFKML